MKKKVFPLAKAYQLLEPGPVVWVSTSHGGKDNVMTMSWQMMLDFVPPTFACVIDARAFTFGLLKKSKECVINIPTADMVKTVVGVGSTTGAKIDKFKKFKLTKEPASLVQAPLIGECYANLECKVIDMHLAETYNVFFLEIVKAWITTSKKVQRTLHHRGNGYFAVDGKIVHVPFKG